MYEIIFFVAGNKNSSEFAYDNLKLSKIFTLPRIVLRPYLYDKYKKNCGHFSWMELSCLKVKEPLRGDSLLFTNKSPKIPGTHLTDLGKMKG